VIEPPREIRTKRLWLRWPGLADAEAIFEEYATDPEVTRYLTWRPHSELGTVTAFLEDTIAHNESGHAYSWALTDSAAGRTIGMLGARVRGHMIDIGYVLAKKYWGKGYMPEAVSWFTEWAIRQPGIYRVWAVCDTQNLASARTLEKSGFEREGMLHRWIVHPNVSSEPRDCYIYGRSR